MEIIKMIRGNVGDMEHLENLVDYISDDRKLNIGGNGVNYNTPYAVADQMMALKEYYEKEDNCAFIHAIVSYGEPNLTAEQACQYTKQIASYFEDEYQTLWCTHAADHGCSQYHMHMLINPVSYKDGKMMNTSQANYKDFEKHVQEVTGQKTDLKFGRKAKSENKSTE